MKCSNDKPIVYCKNCKFKVTDKDGNYNPYSIVCEYWNSDGLEENDFCSQGIEGKFEYDELAVTPDGKTYDETIKESFESKNGMDLCCQTKNAVIGRCDNCNSSEEIYFDGEKWKYCCENPTSPMAGDYVEGNWSCKKFREKGK